MGHTFLLAEGEWTATGALHDASGKTAPVTGSARLTHAREEWINQSEMIVHSDPPLTIRNLYHIAPFLPGANQTSWQCESSVFGASRGVFVIVEDSIFSSGLSADGHSTTVECLWQESPQRYQVRSTAFRNGVFQAGIAAVLTRRAPAQPHRSE